MTTKLAFITELGGGERPDHELPGGRPDRPDQGLPGHGHPDQGLPGSGAHPWYPSHLPPHGSTMPLPPPVTPDNTLPTPPSGAIISLPIFLPPGETKPTPPPTAGTKPVEPPPPVAGQLPAEGKPLDPNIKFELKWSKEYGWVLIAVVPPHAQPK